MGLGPERHRTRIAGGLQQHENPRYRQCGGVAEFAPLEMDSARTKMAAANKAMADKDYKLAATLATEAQADAKLAQGKANNAKAQAAADALQDNLRVLREELDRASKTN